MSETVTLYRPTGPKELALVANSGFRPVLKSVHRPARPRAVQDVGPSTGDGHSLAQLLLRLELLPHGRDLSL